MKERHVILRALGAPARDGFLGGAHETGPIAGPAELGIGGMRVEVDEIEAGRMPELSRSADVLAIAPIIPMKLIEPVAMKLTAELAPTIGAPDWGVHAVGADATPFTGDGVVVAVLDTGIDSSHAAFSGVTLIEKNFTDDADNGDQHGHGTHCAGTIFGRNVNETRIGVAPGVKRALIGKVIGRKGAPSEQIVRAIQWAVSEGANVISMSLGIDFPGFQKQLQDLGLPPELATSRALAGYRANVLLFERLAATVKAFGAFGHATVIVAAAGNESRTDLNPDFKIAVSPPAVSEGILSVAALGQVAGGYVVAPFSNTGAQIAGPGVAITSAKRGGGLATMSGTSMAAPHVAGAAVLWAEKLKSMGPLNAGLLAAKVVASGTVSGLKAGFDPVDVGGGLVRAPQN